MSARSAGTKYFQNNLPDVCAVYEALADEESRDVFLRIVKARTTNNISLLPFSSYGEYQHPLVCAALGDVVCDGGLYEGLSMQVHAWRVGPTGRVYGFDPEKQNASIVKHNLLAFPNVALEELALFDKETELHIAYSMYGSHVLAQPYTASRKCRAVTLDGYLNAKNEGCDLLSLDVEGVEPEILKGAMQTIRRHRPKLQISIYHRDEHILEIPLLLMRENLGYALYMGHHSNGFFHETILYATTQTKEKTGGSRDTEALTQLAWRSEQPAAEARAAITAEQLSGRNVLFWGAGAAYEHYKGLFRKSRPFAILLDDMFIQRRIRDGSTIDGIPLRSFDELEEDAKKLPIVVFSRLEHSFDVLNNIRKCCMPHPPPDIYPCTLFG
jgi:FkbM family methyltransferase